MYNVNIQQNTTLSTIIVIKNSISDVGREPVSDFLYSQKLVPKYYDNTGNL